MQFDEGLDFVQMRDELLLRPTAERAPGRLLAASPDFRCPGRVRSGYGP